MSLSQEPAFSYLRDNFVVGYKDITGESYAGVSGVHMPTGNAVPTTNGAGPHNLQTFVLAPDGTVMTCLPGYWAPQDLVSELKFGQDLYKVWSNRYISRAQKDQQFRSMQMAHLRSHPPDEARRSRMQGFDQKYEAKNRLNTSDCIINPQLASQILDKNMMKPAMGAFKTTDEIMHERMAQRPFVPYQNFDVVAFTDYGRPFYNKNEDQRTATGEVNKDLVKGQPLMGNTAQMPGKRGRMQQQGQMANGGRMMSGGAGYLARRGIRTFFRAMR